MHVLKKIFKILVWIVGSVVLLLVLIAFALQIPSVQNFIIQKATTYVSNKTHTKVDIARVGITFPKSIFIDGLFLGDLSNDTLLYAGGIKVNLDMLDLIKGNIHLHSVSLENVTGNVSRAENDSLFNFNFLITAFSSPNKEKTPKGTSSGKNSLAIDNIDLKNIRLVYADHYSGIISDVLLQNLKLEIDKLDFDKQVYEINELLVDGVAGNLAILKQSTKNDESKNNSLPTIIAKHIEIKNTSFAYADNLSKQSIKLNVGNFNVLKVNVDLTKENILLDNLSLAQSNFQCNSTEESKQKDDSILSTPIEIPTQNNWQVAVKKIQLDDNKFAYNIVNRPVVAHVFDASHINYQTISLNATDLFYSTNKTHVNVKMFTALDPDGIVIKNFSTNFYMDTHTITADQLKIKTQYSGINGSLKTEFSSLNHIKDSLANLFVSADLSSVTIYAKDILYFAPQLAVQPFFKGGNNYASLSGKINGPIKNLHGEKIILHTAGKTLLTTDFTIAGLPNAQRAYFNFPNLKIITGRNDLFALLGSKIIPDNISLPANINLQAKFKGQLKNFEASFGLGTDYGSLSGFALIDKHENFKSDIKVNAFDLGRLLKNDTMFGPVTLTASANGHGLDKKTITANVKADVPQVYLHQYNYHLLTVDGKIKGQEFEGKINLNDTNIVFDFDGLVNINPGEEQYKFSLDLKGADLKNLKFTTEDIRIGLVAVTDLKGKDMNTINGNAGITKIIVAKNGEKYILDSVMFASINEKRRSEFNVNSALIGIKYNGTFAPGDLMKEVKKYFNDYFPVLETKEEKPAEAQKLNFEIQLHNHPVLTALLPQLTEFEPGIITGSFDSEKKQLSLKANINNINYASTQIRNLVLDINGDDKKLKYQLSCKEVSNSTLRLQNFLVDGNVQDKTLNLNVSSIDDQKQKKVLVETKITKEEANYKLVVGSNQFYLANKKWEISPDNYLLFGSDGMLIHNLSLTESGQGLTINSVNNKFNDDLSVKIKNFQLASVSHIVDKDTNLVAGIVNGDVVLKRIRNAYGLIADASINSLTVREINIGNLSLKAQNTTGEKFDVNIKLAGAGNELNLDGYTLTKDSSSQLDFNANIKSLSIKTIEAFSFGQIKNADGSMRGQFAIKGDSKQPDITGSLTFDNVYANPAALNNRLHLQNETIQIKTDGVYFTTFTINDEEGNAAVIDGSVNMQHFTDFKFNLDVGTDNFMVFNTTDKDNKMYYGKMIIDSRIKIGGTMNLPVVSSNLKLKNGSNFTFAVPEQKLTTDRGEGIVLFVDSLKLNPIITRNEKTEEKRSALKGFDISSNIQVDSKATLRLLVDPTTNDSLVVKGDASLTFALDPSGKISLTGTYTLTEGSYLVSLQSLIKKQFKIESGSTIVWNGDPLDADVNINAIYEVRTSPADLVADQMGGLSESEKNVYRQRLPFLVYLKLNGALLKPEINFAIELPPQEKGAMGGAVNAKLNLLNDDPSALNKQVFALLVLGRFIQENPLESSNGAGVASVARTSVSKFLSAELNLLGSKVIPGVELNFDVQSYDDYSSGSAEGRTQVEIGLKKQLLNDRVEVQVGGSVDVEGDKAKQNNASELTGDVAVEYKMTEDGRYRLKGFRHNQYEGAIEGQIVETGGGVLYTRDFDKWKDFVRPPKKEKKQKLKIKTTEVHEPAGSNN